MIQRNCESTPSCACAVRCDATMSFLPNLPLPQLMSDNLLSQSVMSNSSRLESSCLGLAPFSPSSGSCSIPHNHPLDIVMEENIRMHQAINNMVSTLAKWMRQNREQAEQVRLLSETLQESDKHRKKLEEDLKAMRIQVQTSQTDWEAERQDRLQADQDKERAKQMILKLQEENWRLRKARSSILISRGPSIGSENGSSTRPNTPLNPPQ